MALANTKPVAEAQRKETQVFNGTGVKSVT